MLPLNGYLMAWLVHGITAKESLQWQNTPGVSADLSFSLRHFEPGMSFPSFTRHLCWTVHELLGSRPVGTEFRSELSDKKAFKTVLKTNGFYLR